MCVCAVERKLAQSLHPVHPPRLLLGVLIDFTTKCQTACAHRVPSRHRRALCEPEYSFITFGLLLLLWVMVLERGRLVPGSFCPFCLLFVRLAVCGDALLEGDTSSANRSKQQQNLTERDYKQKHVFDLASRIPYAQKKPTKSAL